MKFEREGRAPRTTRAPHGNRGRAAGAAALVFGTLGLWAVGSALSPAPAQADTCSECPEPAEAELVAASGYAASDIGGMFGKWLTFAAGECSLTIAPAGKRQLGIELFWSAKGEAWNCPDSSSDSTIRVDLGDMKSFRWNMSATGGLKLGADDLGSVLASVTSGDEVGQAQRVAAGIQQTIHAKDCHRVEWAAYYFVAKIEADVDVTVTRRYHWWVKESSFASKVLASGDVSVTCGAGRMSAGRLEPISAHVALFDRRCSNCLDTPQFGYRGFFPPLPEPIPPFNPFGNGPTPSSGGGPGDPPAPAPTPPAPSPTPPAPAPSPAPSPTPPAPSPTPAPAPTPGPTPAPTPGGEPRPPLPDDLMHPPQPWSTPGVPGDNDGPLTPPGQPGGSPDPFDPFSPWILGSLGGADRADPIGDRSAARDASWAAAAPSLPS